jgi:arylsulfatase
MATLRELQVDDNTLVMFLSDNGGCSEEPGGRDPSQRRPGPRDDYVAVGPAWGWAQNSPFRRYKAWVHEGGISTPFIARWPKVISPNKITAEVAHIIDVMPTVLEIAGAEYPKKHKGLDIIPVEGLSFLPILESGTRKGHEKLYWEWSGNRAARHGDWKVVWDKMVKEWELYNLKVDRTEVNNLAGKYPAKVAEMRDDWLRWAKGTGLEVSQD